MDARPSVPGERRRAVARYLLPAVILVAGFFVHLLISHATDRRVADVLRNRTHDTVVAMQAQVRNYEDAAYSVAAVFAASNHVTHREFADNIAAQRLHTRYPGVQRVGFADRSTPMGCPRSAAASGARRATRCSVTRTSSCSRRSRATRPRSSPTPPPPSDRARRSG